jgi:hypothetical protein
MLCVVIGNKFSPFKLLNAESFANAKASAVGHGLRSDLHIHRLAG